MIVDAPMRGGKMQNRRYPLERFEQVKRVYGEFSSWAVWALQNGKPKSGICDLSIFDTSLSDAILDQIHVNYVLVGLNVSRNPGIPPFSNFHSGDRRSQDYKLRRAIAGTPLWGSYLTDILKGLEQKDSRQVIAHVQQNPALLKSNLDTFREEMDAICAENPTLVALGSASYGLLQKHLAGEFKVAKMTHYAHQIAADRYRCEVLAMLENLSV